MLKRTETEKKLDELISIRIKDAKEKVPGDEESKRITEEVAELIKQQAAIEKTRSDAYNRDQEIRINRDIEIRRLELEIKQANKDNRRRIASNIISVGGIVVPAGCAVWGLIKSLAFEQDGIITASGTRESFKKVMSLPFRK